MRTTFLEYPDPEGLSPRALAKARRRIDFLRAGAKIMADKGFHAMRLEDLGEAVGVSGPAVYRHFSSKEEILNALMLGVSTHLLDEATQLITGISDVRERLEILIDYQISFALQRSELIRLHNRELYRLGDEGLSQVRHAQGRYLKLWAGNLAEFDPDLGPVGARISAQLVVALINSAEHLTVEGSEAMLRRQLMLSARSVAGLR